MPDEGKSTIKMGVRIGNPLPQLSNRGLYFIISQYRSIRDGIIDLVELQQHNCEKQFIA